MKVTAGWKYDEEKDTVKQERLVIGYAKTRAEGLQMLAEYHQNPYDIDLAKLTFSQLYEMWSKEAFIGLSEQSINSYTSSYKNSKALYDKQFKALKTMDFQRVIDTCGKNYPMLKKIKQLFTRLSSYAMKNDIISKNYAHFVEIEKHKNKNPNKIVRSVFTDEEIEILWKNKDIIVCKYALILIYTGVRIGELLALEKKNVHLDKKVFNVVASKTENGIRVVPIAEKIYPFFVDLMKSDSECLIVTSEGTRMTDTNFRKRYWQPVMDQIDMGHHKPHDTRHTCTSLMYRAGIDQTMQKKILGHSGTMSLTERVYTHLEYEQLLDAINKI